MKVLDVLRTEKKYPLRYETARKLLHRLQYIMESDPYTESSDGYRVRSLYFDSFADRDFFEKEAGLECRKKIRLRTYGTGGVIKLEWKQKQGNVQRKRSILVSREEAESLMNANYGCLLRREESLAKEFYGLLSVEAYRPRCLVQYDRIALIEPTNDIRITFDSNLRVHEGCFDLFASDSTFYPAANADMVTLEVKYNRFLLRYIKDMISPYTTPQAAVSKYYAARKYGLGGTIV